MSIKRLSENRLISIVLEALVGQNYSSEKIIRHLAKFSALLSDEVLSHNKVKELFITHSTLFTELILVALSSYGPLKFRFWVDFVVNVFGYPIGPVMKFALVHRLLYTRTGNSGFLEKCTGG